MARWNAPEAMNRMWSVLTMPYFVLTVVPSTSGSRSRCTPARETSAPPCFAARSDLVDLVEEHDAVLLDVLRSPCCFISSSLTQLGRLPRRSAASALPAPSSCAASCVPPPMLGEHRPDLLRHFFHARRRHDFDLRRARRPLRSRFPCRRARLRAGACGTSGGWCRPRCRFGAGDVEAEVARRRHQDVEDAVLGGVLGALARSCFISLARVCLTPMSTRSRMMVSTSRPT